MQLARWFGFSNEEDAILERLLGDELRALEQVFEDAKRKKEFADALNTRWIDTEQKKLISALQQLIKKNPLGRAEYIQHPKED